MLGCLMLLALGVSAAPGSLRCEFLTNPVGLDTAVPRLSWRLSTGRQTAYQIQVAVDRARLLAGQADLWDSGRVPSAQSHLVPYRGVSLPSRQHCWWRVRVADGAGVLSDWSQPARWTMGLLGPEEWQAKWIGSEAPLSVPDAVWSTASWIWAPHLATGDLADLAAGDWLFRRRLDVPAGVAQAHLALTADESFWVELDGQPVGEQTGPKDAARRRLDLDLTRQLAPGAHELTVRVLNQSGGGGSVPARLLARLRWSGAAGELPDVLTDTTWQVSRGPSAAAVRDWQPAAALVGADQRWRSPLLRREFDVTGPLRSAQLSVCGLGFGEYYLDGHRLSDDVLNPPPTQFQHRVLYSSYDLTDLLAPGRHALGAMLGNGEYNQSAWDAWDGQAAPWRGAPRLLARLDLQYADGRREAVVTDEHWRQHAGPMLADCTKLGVDYDARADQPGWSRIGFDESAWRSADTLPAPKGTVRALRCEPCRAVRAVPVKAWSQPSKGVWVADLGENISGWSRLHVRGEAGSTVTLRHAELLHADGTLNADNINGIIFSPDVQVDRYTLRGDVNGELFEPRFTYHGFQYVQVEGLPGPPDANTLVGVQVRTGFEPTGAFDCSNDLLRDIDQICLRAYEGNFVGHPTDCPHREKNGWLGDSQMVAEVGLWHYGVAAAYSRWVDDMGDAQRADGKLPGLVPTAGWHYDFLQGAPWAAAYVVIPYRLWQFTGDSDTARRHLAGMARLVDYFTPPPGELVHKGDLGDWLPIRTGTPLELTSTAYTYHMADLLSQMAGWLGEDGTQAKYRAVAEQLQRDFNAAYLAAETGQYANGSQTAQSCALYLGLAPPELRQKVADRLAQAVHDADDHLDVGILGTKMLFRALSDNGYGELAYRVATQTTSPSYAWPLSQGATTLWETFHGEGSHNHPTFGDLSSWFIEYLAGLRVDPRQPGLQHFIVQPMPVGDLTFARAEHLSPYGRIVVDWRRNGSRLSLDVAVAPNSSATVLAPRGSMAAAADHRTELGPGEHSLNYEIGG